MVPIIAKLEKPEAIQRLDEILAKTDPKLAASPFIFPSVQYIKDNNVQGFRALTPEEDAKYSARWQKVQGN